MAIGPTALVISCDETFAPLAKGLVLSLRKTIGHSDEFAPYLVDIGCSESTLAWMARHGVESVRFVRDEYYRRQFGVNLKPYQDAQLCRPFLPRLVPGFSTYLWCDSDIWIQDAASLRLYRDVANNQPNCVAVSPLIDVSYEFYYQNGKEFIDYARLWYTDAYGPTLAECYANRAILSSGIFAMRAENPIWLSWALELQSIYSRTFKVAGSIHLAEQTALNYLLHSSRNFVPLEAIHNYNCHIGIPVRHGDGTVVVGKAPFRPIGVVHLTYASKMMARYMAEGILFDRGDYLDAGEIDGLRQLAHY